MFTECNYHLKIQVISVVDMIVILDVVDHVSLIVFTDILILTFI